MPENYTKEEIEELNEYLDSTSKKYDDLCDQINSDIYERQTAKKESLIDIWEAKNKIIEADDKLQEKLQKRMLSTMKDVHDFEMQVKRDNLAFEKEQTVDYMPTVLDYL